MPVPADAWKLAKQILPLIADNPALLSQMLSVIEQMDPCQHSIDFASITWFGKPYHLTAPQARVVRVLWKAWKRGTLDVRQETLLRAAGSDTTKLSNVFKDAGDVWGQVIVPGNSRGSFRLKID